MLRELRIKNFAIVDNLSLSFEKGLNVITGETGAGKSIIVNALDLILGGRASSEFIKTDSNDAWIEAFFEIKECPLFDLVNLSCDEGTIVKRIINKNGKSRAYINDSLVTIQTLSTFGKDLVDLHGQHEHQSLLSTSVQRTVVDSYGGLEGLVNEVKGLYDKYQDLNKTFSEIKNRQREREQRIDILKYQINEIDSAGLEKGEKKGLLQEKAILSNLTHLKYLSETAFTLLKDDEGSILEKLTDTIRLIEEVNKIDGSSQELLKMIHEAEAIIQDSIYSLREIKERYDCDPDRLDDVESRLALIEKLERKYGEGVEGIFKYREKAGRELNEIEELQERYEDIEKELTHIHSLLINKSDALSSERKETARRIEKTMKEVLNDLAFNKPDLKIDFSSIPLSSSGIDRVDFLFSANPGQPPRTLNKIASGGEISRVMLALKSIFAEVDSVNILIFDEIDAGVGGKTADSVGKRLKKLSDKYQVICITHLPQIASRADNHLFVTKKEVKNKVTVKVKNLGHDERLQEIARMMSGSITDTSLRHAEELLKKEG